VAVVPPGGASRNQTVAALPLPGAWR
jgi:hypothetical protein